MALILAALTALSGTPVYAAARPASFNGILVPAENGFVEEVHEGTSGRTILYIQDAHSSLEAQENIARLIHHLTSAYGIKTVYEEGYEGPVPSDKYFGWIHDRQIRRKVSFEFVKKHRLGGAEFAHINRAADFELIGADDIAALLENIDWYGKSASVRASVEKDLAALSSEVRRLADAEFSSGLKEWLRLRERERSRQLDPIEYVKRTAFLAGEETLQGYPALRAALAAAEENAAKNITEVNAAAFLREKKNFEETTADKLAAGPREREIYEYYEGFELLRRLSRTEVSLPEYRGAKGKLETLTTEGLARLIVQSGTAPVSLAKRWERNMKSAVRFYEIAQNREKALAEALAKSENEISIVVFGGFHKENIKTILRARGDSFMIISPRITKNDPAFEDGYRALMSAGVPDLPVPPSAASAARYIPLYVDGEKFNSSRLVLARIRRQAESFGFIPEGRAELRGVVPDDYFEIARGILDNPDYGRQLALFSSLFENKTLDERHTELAIYLLNHPHYQVRHLASDEVSVLPVEPERLFSEITKAEVSLEPYGFPSGITAAEFNPDYVRLNRRHAMIYTLATVLRPEEGGLELDPVQKAHQPVVRKAIIETIAAELKDWTPEKEESLLEIVRADPERVFKEDRDLGLFEALRLVVIRHEYFKRRKDVPRYPRKDAWLLPNVQMIVPPSEENEISKKLYAPVLPEESPRSLSALEENFRRWVEKNNLLEWDAGERYRSGDKGPFRAELVWDEDDFTRQLLVRPAEPAKFPDRDKLAGTTDKPFHLPRGILGEITFHFHTSARSGPMLILDEIQSNDGYRNIKDKHRRRLDAWRRLALARIGEWAELEGVRLLASTSETQQIRYGGSFDAYELRINYEEPFDPLLWQEIEMEIEDEIFRLQTAGDYFLKPIRLWREYKKNRGAARTETKDGPGGGRFELRLMSVQALSRLRFGNVEPEAAEVEIDTALAEGRVSPFTAPASHETGVSLYSVMARPEEPTLYFVNAGKPGPEAKSIRKELQPEAYQAFYFRRNGEGRTEGYLADSFIEFLERTGNREILDKLVRRIASGKDFSDTPEDRLELMRLLAAVQYSVAFRWDEILRTGPLSAAYIKEAAGEAFPVKIPSGIDELGIVKLDWLRDRDGRHLSLSRSMIHNTWRMWMLVDHSVHMVTELDGKLVFSVRGQNAGIGEGAIDNFAGHTDFNAAAGMPETPEETARREFMEEFLGIADPESTEAAEARRLFNEGKILFTPIGQDDGFANMRKLVLRDDGSIFTVPMGKEDAEDWGLQGQVLEVPFEAANLFVAKISDEVYDRRARVSVSDMTADYQAKTPAEWRELIAQEKVIPGPSLQKAFGLAATLDPAVPGLLDELLAKGGTGEQNESRAEESEKGISRETARQRLLEAQKKTYYAWIDDLDGNVTYKGSAYVSPAIIKEYQKDLRAGRIRAIVTGRAEVVSPDLKKRDIHDIEEVARRIRHKLPRYAVANLISFPENGAYAQWLEWDTAKGRFERKEIDLVKRYGLVPQDYEFPPEKAGELYQALAKHLEEKGFPAPFKFLEKKRYGFAAWLNNSLYADTSKAANEMARYIREFLGAYPEYRLFDVVSTSYTVDVQVKGLDKKLAVRYLAEAYDIPEETIIATDDKATAHGNGYGMTERPGGFSTAEYDPQSSYQVPLSQALGFKGLRARRILRSRLKLEAPPVRSGLRALAGRSEDALWRTKFEANEFIVWARAQGFIKTDDDLYELLDPRAADAPGPDEIAGTIIPEYIPGPFINAEAAGTAVWERNRGYMRNVFKKEADKAAALGFIKPEEIAQKQALYDRLLDGILELEDRPGHRYAEGLTNLLNDKVFSRLSYGVLYGDFNFDTAAALEPIARKANEIARKALKGSAFEETIRSLKKSVTSEDKVRRLRTAVQAALYAAAPRIRYSDPSFQADPRAVETVRKLVAEAKEHPLAIDSTKQFVAEVLEAGRPMKITYFFDDNGDSVYHLHLVQAYLEMNPYLSFTIVGKRYRYKVDSTVEDLAAEIESPGFEGLKAMIGQGRLSLLLEGPEYPGINFLNASAALHEAVRKSDLLIVVGASHMESMNGIRKPAYHQASVDLEVHQNVSGLPGGSLYFARTDGNEKYFNGYFQMKSAGTRSIASGVYSLSDYIKEKETGITVLSDSKNLEPESRSELRLKDPAFENMSVPSGVVIDAREIAKLSEEAAAGFLSELLVLVRHHPFFDVYVKGLEETPRGSAAFKNFELLRKSNSRRVHKADGARRSLMSKRLILDLSVLENAGSKLDTRRLVRDAKEKYHEETIFVPAEYSGRGSLKAFLNLAETLTPAALLDEVGEAYAVRGPNGRLRISEDFAADLWGRIRADYVIQWSA